MDTIQLPSLGVVGTLGVIGRLAVAACFALLVFAAWKAFLSYFCPAALGVEPFPDSEVKMTLKPHPIMGHIPYMGKCQIAGTKVFVDNATKEGLCSFYLFNAPAVLVTKAEHVKKCLNKQTFRAKIPILAVHMEMFLGRRSIVQLMNKEWDKVRGKLTHSFKAYSFDDITRDMSSVASSLTASINGQIRDAREGNMVAFDIFSTMKKATLDVIGRTAFDYEFNCCTRTTKEPVAEAFEWLLDECSKRSYETPLDPRTMFYWLPTARNAKHKKMRNVVRSTLQECIDRKRAQLRKGGDAIHNDFLRHMVEGSDSAESSDSALSDEEMQDNLLTFFFGGFDTTSIALTYALYEIAKHPEIEKEILAETDRVLGKRSGFAPIALADVRKLVYCTAVFKEALRMYPPAPVTARTTEKPLELEPGKLTVPAGTLLYIPIWWVHRSKDNWGDDAEVFKPERFVRRDDEGVAVSHAGKHHPYAWIPFSGGKRFCIGQRFATVEGTLFLASVS